MERIDGYKKHVRETHLEMPEARKSRKEKEEHKRNEKRGSGKESGDRSSVQTSKETCGRISPPWLILPRAYLQRRASQTK